MKKVILTFVLSIFAISMSAQTEATISDSSECMDEAWAAGTEAGEQAGGVDTMWGSVIAYLETDKYYRENCL